MSEHHARDEWPSSGLGEREADAFCNSAICQERKVVESTDAFDDDDDDDDDDDEPKKKERKGNDKEKKGRRNSKKRRKRSGKKEEESKIHKQEEKQKDKGEKWLGQVLAWKTK